MQTENAMNGFKVVIEQDGCYRCDVKSAGQTITGTLEQCAQFVANHLPPEGWWYSLSVYPVEPGPLTSYMVPAPTVARRRRIHLRSVR
jgi:hypothetical protein